MASADDEDGRLWASRADIRCIAGLAAADVWVQQCSALALGNMLAERTPDEAAAKRCAVALLETLTTATNTALAELCAFALANAVRTKLLASRTVIGVLSVSGDWVCDWVTTKVGDGLPEAAVACRDTVVTLLGAMSQAVALYPDIIERWLLRLAAYALKLAASQYVVDETVCVAAMQVVVLVFGRVEYGATIEIEQRDLSKFNTLVALREPVVFAELKRTGRGTFTQVLVMANSLFDRAGMLHEFVETHDMSVPTRELLASLLRCAVFDGTELTLRAAHANGLLCKLMGLAKSVSREGARQIVGGVVAGLLPFSKATQQQFFAYLMQECGALVLVAEVVKDLAQGRARPDAIELDSLLRFMHEALELAEPPLVKATSHSALERALGRIQATQADPGVVTVVGSILSKLDLGA